MRNVITFENIESSDELFDWQKDFYDDMNTSTRACLSPENLIALEKSLGDFLLKCDPSWDQDVVSIDSMQLIANNLIDVWIASSDEMLQVIPLANFVQFFTIIKPHFEIFWGYETLEFFSHIDENLTIYRGGKIDDDTIAGVSWTLKPSLAACYAKKNGYDFVLQGKITKENILIIFPFEEEIIPITSTVSDIVKISIDEILLTRSEK